MPLKNPGVLVNHFPLSKKLFVFISLTLLIIILPFFYIAKTSLAEFGSYAYTVNKQQIESMSRSYLSRIADEQANRYDEIFKRIRTASSLMGSQLTNIYHHTEVLYQKPFGRPSNLQRNQKNRIFFSPRSEPVVTAYWGGDTISDDIKKELIALSHFEPMLIKSKELVHESIATHIITASGIGRYYTRNPALKKACYDLPMPDQFDLRSGEPVTIFTKQKTKLFNTQWTDIYKDDVLAGLMMTASTPIYDQKGDFKGITGIDIPVEYIIHDMTENPFVSGNENILFAFLQNREGKIIAFPKGFLGLFGLNIDLTQFENSSDILNYSLQQSSIETVRNLGPKIRDYHKRIIELAINHETFLLAIGHLDSVEWQLVLVAKETEMITSVNKTGIALKKSLNSIWKDFIGYAILIIGISVPLIFCAISVFISPINKLMEVTQNVAKGDFSSTLEMTRKDEIGMLAGSFNIMVEKLKGFERIVAKRTAQLKRLNEHIVFAEEKERKAIASDLHDSVTQTLAMSISKLKNIRESDPGMNEGELPEIQAYLEQSILEIRSLIYQLSPPILDDFDIDIALGFFVEETNVKHHSDFHYINATKDPVTLDQAVKVTLYRAVNELVINILKHSGSKHGVIEISKTKEVVTVRVEDHGSGFDVDMIKEPDSLGFGLHSLTERIENFGGQMILNSEPGKGTIIYLTIPVSPGKESRYEKS